MKSKNGLLALSCLFATVAFATPSRVNLNTLLMPADRLAAIKAALPKVSDPALRATLAAPETLWYDATVMTPSYQDSVGAASNATWPDLVAGTEDVIGGLHDRKHKRWQFPFSTTAGTDDSTNLEVKNFVRLPQNNGSVRTIQITKEIRNAGRPEWTWTYPEGTVFGEVLFITDGSKLLPSEIRTRTRYANGWAMNVFRPFPRASELADAIKRLRPQWNLSPNLVRMVDFLQDKSTLQPFTLAAKAGLASTFREEGYLDYLPDFGDDQLVRELLTTTGFRSAYDTSWKEDGAKRTFAASTKSALSIVPNNYTAGVIRVTDDSCVRCHKDTARLVSEFYDPLYLYGEVWGKDGIFSFHPFDESRYPELRRQGFDVDGYADNRALNPKLRQAGIFTTVFR